MDRNGINYLDCALKCMFVALFQIERIVLFLLQQQGHLASRIEELGERRTALLEQYDISQVSQLRDGYREVGFDLIKLLHFVDINATGIRKILKKFDKRFGYKFTDYYVTTRANHPYSQLQQVFKQVGIVAVVGALSRNLEYLQHHEGSFVSIYDHPSVTLRVGLCKSSHQGNANLEEGLAQPLVSTERAQDENSEDNDDSEVASENSHGPATSIASAYRLLTPSVKAQLLIYFMLKYAMEILLSESSVVTTYYFSWSTSAVAIFLAILGLTVLPVNAIVGIYITNLFEDRQILLASEVMVLIGIIMSFCFTPHYSIPQYVISALITFVFAEVLEGVNLSLLSRVMSSRLSRGTYNGGLLSTEAGTLARVVADATITAAGYLGTDLLLNVTLLPPLVICIVSIAATLYTYNTLY
nr:unnamed protein product [Digitaria exilis]